MTEEQKLGLRLEALADQLVASIKDHEREAYEGQVCAPERWNAIAYFMHRLDMNAKSLRPINDILLVYMDQCPQPEEE